MNKFITYIFLLILSSFSLLFAQVSDFTSFKKGDTWIYQYWYSHASTGNIDYDLKYTTNQYKIDSIINLSDTLFFKIHEIGLGFRYTRLNGLCDTFPIKIDSVYTLKMSYKDSIYAWPPAFPNQFRKVSYEDKVLFNNDTLVYSHANNFSGNGYIKYLQKYGIVLNDCSFGANTKTNITYLMKSFNSFQIDTSQIKKIPNNTSLLFAYKESNSFLNAYVMTISQFYSEFLFKKNDYTFEVYSITGKKILSFTSQKQLNNLAAGTYIIKCFPLKTNLYPILVKLNHYNWLWIDLL